jgi:hypothetical protein
VKSKDLRARPRWVQHIRAILGGYFWLPCPMCGKPFGGHEAHGSLYYGMGHGALVCANCAELARLASLIVSADEVDA